MKDIHIETNVSEDAPHRQVYSVRIGDYHELVLEQDEAKRLFACLDTALGGHVIGEQVRQAKSEAVDRIVEAIINTAKAGKTGWIG